MTNLSEVVVTNFDEALLRVRAHSPDSINCDGIAIVQEGRSWFCSANPDPRGDDSETEAFNKLQSAYSQIGAVRRVSKLILNLPSGMIYKWQVHLAPKRLQDGVGFGHRVVRGSLGLRAWVFQSVMMSCNMRFSL